MKKVTVIGSGVMGHGIAQRVAQAKVPVVLFDINEESLVKAKSFIESNLTMQVNEQLLSEQEKEETLTFLELSSHLETAIQESELIIEAISEKLELKHGLYRSLEALVSQETVIASNTSTFSMKDLTEGATNPERFVVTHFFNPAQFVPLVEVVRGDQTTEHVVNETMTFMKQIGKSPILLNKDIPGFVANRLQAALVREAFYLLEEGVADARSIDLAVTDGPGFRWGFAGPLETADFGGLDIWKSVVENLAPTLSENTKVPDFIQTAIDEGNLGTKTTEGIYSYSSDIIQDRLVERDQYLMHLGKLKRST